MVEILWHEPEKRPSGTVRSVIPGRGLLSTEFRPKDQGGGLLEKGTSFDLNAEAQPLQRVSVSFSC